ncbi:MAG TPA: Arm DNA-binding domain-containing protein, partial [Steroidobacteraceae bacterium]|nr:Arm DNA-binding domain-containing protein [Steroidobacteraceae bacterium]
MTTAPQHGQREVFVGGGLFMLLTPQERGLQLKDRRDGKEKLLSLGLWPGVSLAEARQKAAVIKTQVVCGQGIA